MSKLNESVPHHVAIVMDGNGRWAQQHNKARSFGHKAGSDQVKRIVEESRKQGIKVLTLFSFSSENWKRPKQEVSFIMELLISGIEREMKNLNENGVQFRVIGDRQHLSSKLLKAIEGAEALTADNTDLILQLAFSYGGRWDIVQAAQQLAIEIKEGALDPDQITETTLSSRLSFSDLPDVDFFIRTGKEVRISNFILWQSAYAEFYFSDKLWPEFTKDYYREVLAEYSHRRRRFGLTDEQAH